MSMANPRALRAVLVISLCMVAIPVAPAVAQTVLAVGYNQSGQCNVSGWSGISAIAAGNSHTVGLKADGTVVAVGPNGAGECNVSGWTGIAAVAAGSGHTVGLTGNGYVLARGDNSNHQCDTRWSGIIAIAAGDLHTVGLRTDGTAVAVGQNIVGQCNVSNWQRVIAISAGASHTVGLRSDGTVVAVGANNYGQCNVSGWSRITAIAAGGGHTVGVKTDGTVVAVGSNSSRQCIVAGWSGITAIAAGAAHTIGLKISSAVVAVGDNSRGQCNVTAWKGITAIAGGFGHTVGIRAPATRLAFLSQPGRAWARVAGSPRVRVAAQDRFGLTVTHGTHTVTIAIQDNPAGAALAGTVSRRTTNGLSDFADLCIDKPGVGYALGATASGLASVVSDPFDVVLPPPVTAAFVEEPTDTTAGDILTPSVKVSLINAFGEVATAATTPVTLSVASGPAGATLLGATTAVPADGVAVFTDLRLIRPGTYILRASAPGVSDALSRSFVVAVGPAAAVAFVSTPGVGYTSVPLVPAIIVHVLDAAGNTVPEASNEVTVGLADLRGATLQGDLTAAAVRGTAVFTHLVIDKPGTFYLTASSLGLRSATSGPLTIRCAAKLAFQVQPGNSTVARHITPAIRVVVTDALGSTVMEATNAVTLTIGKSPAGGTLAGTKTTNAVGGVATFSDLSIDRVSHLPYALVASSPGLEPATSADFLITAGAPRTLTFVVQPASRRWGAPLYPAVKVAMLDGLGNVATSAADTITVALATNPGGAKLTGTTTVATVSGVATLSNLRFDKVGVGYRLRATSARRLTTATSNPFNITAGPPHSLAFKVQPSSTIAGSTIAPAVQVAVLDSAKNPCPTATNTVTLALGANPGSALLSGILTGPAASGIAVFSGLSLDRASSSRYTLVASCPGLRTATSLPFAVTAGPAAKLGFAVQPLATPWGAAIRPAVKVAVQDRLGNLVTNAADTIQISIGSNPAGGTLSGSLTGVTVMGAALFPDLRIDKMGAGYTLRATSTAGFTPGTSAAFNVTHRSPARLEFRVRPANATAGATLAPAVQVSLLDAAGNLCTRSTNAVTVTLGTNPTGGMLSGTRTAAAVNGTATFSGLSIARAGEGYTLAASATGLAGATSQSFKVTAGPVAKMAFTVQPGSTMARTAISPAVAVALQDALGNTVPLATDVITTTIATNPASGTLSGTTRKTTAGGVATFANLMIDKPGTGYRLKATSAAGLPAVTSEPFDVGP